MNNVEKIHQEIDTAQERLLNQALSLIEKNTIEDNLNISTKLNELGFVNTPNAIKNNTRKKSIQENQRQAELIKYYSQTYPLLKFLTEDEMERICKKYELIFAPVDNYIKDVPDKNIIEIHNSKKLLNSDIVNFRQHLIIKKWHKYVSREVKNFYNTIKKKHYPYTSLEDEVIVKWFKKNGYDGDFGRKNDNQWIYPNENNQVILKNYDFTKLFIAAPKSHFNLKGLGKNKFGYYSVKIIKNEPKDPIAFRYVKGGIQVLSKWGLEANDEALRNPIEN